MYPSVFLPLSFSCPLSLYVRLSVFLSPYTNNMFWKYYLGHVWLVEVLSSGPFLKEVARFKKHYKFGFSAHF